MCLIKLAFLTAQLFSINHSQIEWWSSTNPLLSLMASVFSVLELLWDFSVFPFSSTWLSLWISVALLVAHTYLELLWASWCYYFCRHEALLFLSPIAIFYFRSTVLLGFFWYIFSSILFQPTISFCFSVSCKHHKHWFCGFYI